MSKVMKKIFEEVLKENELEQFQEMAAVGEIKSPKTGHYYLEVFSREYKHETPHVNLEKPRNKSKFVVAKIEIPKEQPNIDDEPNILWIRENFTIHNSLKNEIQKWFVERNKNGLTGWQLANIFWESQAQSISWGQLK
jgi:hypothetical protein